MPKILIITEGKKPEDKIIRALKGQVGFQPKKEYEFVWGFWGAGILDLIAKLEEADFQDYLPLLKEKEENEGLQRYSVDDFSQTFLLFDFDPQVLLHNEVKDFFDKITDVLDKCNDETSPYGKLFMNYPMVEAYLAFPYKRQCSNTECFFNETSAAQFASTVAKINVAGSAHKYSDDFWLKLCNCHLSKVEKFMGLDSGYEGVADLTQGSIFERQLDLYGKRKMFFSISPVGLLYLSLYGRRFYSAIQPMSDLNCSCVCLDSNKTMLQGMD